MVASSLTVSAEGMVTGSVAVPTDDGPVTVSFKNANPRKLAHYAQSMRAKYDSAQTTDENRRHWANADNLSARAANSPGVRTTLRNRSRYEVGNNTYAKGMGETLANHVIGTGPRLQIIGVPKSDATAVEAEFKAWCREVGLGEKLRVLRMDKYQSGEGFMGLVTNPTLDCPVELDVRTVEADRVADPYLLAATDPRQVDGIELDGFGNVAQYKVLRYHPGDMLTQIDTTPEMVPASQMCHWFTSTRSGQYRGIPEISTALPLFAQLRRFTLAVIFAAEFAANAAGMLETAASADSDEPEGVPFETMDVERGTLMTLPPGYKLNQLKAEQPTTTYAEFKREILKEIARCIGMPYNIAAGDSSSYNFASGRLDHQIYLTMIWIERDHCENIVLWKIWKAWIREARLIEGYLPASLAKGAIPDVQWYWDSIDLGDPSKTASTRDISIRNGTGSLHRFAQEDGTDLETEMQANADAFGVTLDEYRAKLFEKLFGMNAGTPPATPATDSPEDTGTTDGTNTADGTTSEEVSAKMDAYGVGVRAGVITPQLTDEQHFRKQLQMPDMTPEAKAAWKKDAGVRRPITITPPAGASWGTPVPDNSGDGNDTAK